MLKENCKVGIPVKILSKSTGQNIRDLRGVREGIISKAKYEYRVFELMAKLQMKCVEDEIEQKYEQNFSFKPEDLEPLWGVKNG